MATVVRAVLIWENMWGLAESIIDSWSRYRGVDFGTSQASGVNYYGRYDFKILKAYTTGATPRMAREDAS